MELQVGTEYQVNHSRKGTFTAVLRSANDEWAELEIIHGRARALCSCNEAEAGEHVTVRRSFCSFTEAPPGAAPNPQPQE